MVTAVKQGINDTGKYPITDMPVSALAAGTRIMSVLYEQRRRDRARRRRDRGLLSATKELVG